MGSLGGCLKRLSFSKEETAHIRRLASVHRDDGLQAADANLAAVDELIADTERIKQSVLDQLKPTLSPTTYARATNGVATLVHYSRQKGLDEISPKYHGTGQIGAERTRLLQSGKGYLPRSYFYRAGTKIEPRFKGLTKYQVEVPESSLVDLATLTGTPTEREQAAKKAGYKGYYNSESSMPNVVALFEAVEIPKSDSGSKSAELVEPIDTTGGVVEEAQLEDLRSDPLFSPRTWVSQIEKVLEQKMPKSASAAQVKGILSPQNGIKQDELQEMGIDEYLASKDKFDKHNVMEWVRAHQIQAERVTFEKRTLELTPQEIKGIEDKHARYIQEKQDNLTEAENNLKEYDEGMASARGVSLQEIHDRGGALRRMLMNRLVEAEVAVHRAQRERDEELARRSVTEDTTKYASWQLPGGVNYKEVFVTLPASPEAMIELKNWRVQKVRGEDYTFWEVTADRPNGTRFVSNVDVEEYPTETEAILVAQSISKRHESNWAGRWTQRLNEAETEHAGYPIHDVMDPTGRVRATLPSDEAAEYMIREQNRIAQQWQDGHSEYDDVINPIVRLRMNDRTTTDGKKLLFLEEVQPPHDVEQEKMPKWAIKRWREIGLKQALRIAADGEYDAIGWTTGVQQADRYSLRKHLDNLQVERAIGANEFHIRADNAAGDRVLSKYVFDGDLEETVGQELATKIRTDLSPDRVRETGRGWRRQTYRDLDLDIGGQGLMKVYDQDLVHAANALAKKWGVKVGSDYIETGPQEIRTGETYTEKSAPRAAVHSIPVTDAMKTAAKDGLPLFAPAQPKQTETEAFKKWFGDSKVVNADGSPKVVYHGTERGRFTIFQTPSFFTEEKAEAIGYATLTDVDGLPDIRYVPESAAPPIPDRFNPFTDYVPVASDINVPNRIFVEDGTDRLVFWDGNTNPVGDPNIKIVSGVIAQNDKPVRIETEDKGASHPEAVRARQVVRSVYLSIQNPIELPWNEANILGKRLGASAETVKARIAELQRQGYDGIVTESDDARLFQQRSVKQYVPFEPAQIKLADKNTGTFDPNNPDIRFAPKAPVAPTFTVEPPTALDKLVRILQDKTIDIKRIVEAVKDSGKPVADELNPVLKEEMYMARTAQRTKDFSTDELLPLTNAMRLAKVSLEQLDRYLHARHVINDKVNAHLQSINPDLAGTPEYDKLAGITDAEAKTILTAANAAVMEPLAKRVDAIVEKTRNLMVTYGLEKQDTIDNWRKFYTSYVPLHREGFEEEGHPTGTGRSVRGSTVKERTGSALGVSNVLANVAQARDQIITRGEKQRPVIAMAGLLMQYPNPEIATLDKPAQIEMTDPVTGLKRMVPGNLTNYTVPMVRRFDPAQGKVVSMPDPTYKGRDNVVNFRVDGEDYAIVFNERNDRAMEAAKAFKELGTAKLTGVMAAIAPYTRYLASINTQYNPIFGIVNFVRDAQFAVLALGSTPLAGKRLSILNNARHSLRGIFQDARAVRKGLHPTSTTAALWERFQHVGGPTGYRDLFFSSTERSEELERMLNPNSWSTVRDPQSLGRRIEETGFMKLLSDYNVTMENAIRLGVFKTAVDQGLSDIQAASLAKNITVNFNKKGQIGAQMGSLYAFFNANVQGTARIVETLFDRQKNGGFTLSAYGKRLIAGGILTGVLQTFALTMAGFGDDDPPEYIKARNLVIPIPGTQKGYGLIPMPLGFNLLPNVGRMAAEAVRAGVEGKDLNVAKRASALVAAMYGTFSPMGGTGGVIQELSPTAIDPLVALESNKDWTGKSIAKEDRSTLDPTPGHTRARDTASAWAMFLSRAINWATGGTDYTPGVMSPTPDAVDYFIEQLTGGIGREMSKSSQVLQSMITGEELPFHKIPLAGRFAGSVSGTTAIRDRFYDNIKEVNLAYREFEGRAKDHKPNAHEFLRLHPTGRLHEAAISVERTIGELKQAKHELVKKGAPREAIRLREQQITGMMERFNRLVEARQTGVDGQP